MSEKTSKARLKTILVKDTSAGGQGCSSETKVYVKNVIPAHIVEDNDADTGPKASTKYTVTFVEIRTQRS